MMHRSEQCPPAWAGCSLSWFASFPVSGGRALISEHLRKVGNLPFTCPWARTSTCAVLRFLTAVAFKMRLCEDVKYILLLKFQ